MLFSTLYLNRDKIRLEDLMKRSCWKRIKGTNIRIGQALKYGCSLINELIGKEVFKVQKSMLKDEYIKREIEEAVERVIELG
jgi:hypothetical protein